MEICLAIKAPDRLNMGKIMICGQPVDVDVFA
jgi:hypothetical protein